MASRIKTVQSIKKPVTINNRILLKNALVISRLHYTAKLVGSSASNLKISLEKQLRWAIKTCCERRKFDSSFDLKLEYKVLPASCFSIGKEFAIYGKSNITYYRHTKISST